MQKVGSLPDGARFSFVGPAEFVNMYSELEIVHANASGALIKGKLNGKPLDQNFVISNESPVTTEGLVKPRVTSQNIEVGDTIVGHIGDFGFPSGRFSVHHLALINSCSRGLAYLRLKEAQKSGNIIEHESIYGRGKPTKVYSYKVDSSS